MSYNNIRKQQKPYSDLIRHGNAHRRHECKWYRNITTPGRCSAVTEKDGYLDKLHGFVEKEITNSKKDTEKNQNKLLVERIKKEAYKTIYPINNHDYDYRTAVIKQNNLFALGFKNKPTLGNLAKVPIQLKKYLDVLVKEPTPDKNSIAGVTDVVFEDERRLKIKSVYGRINEVLPYPSFRDDYPECRYPIKGEHASSYFIKTGTCKTKVDNKTTCLAKGYKWNENKTRKVESTASNNSNTTNDPNKPSEPPKPTKVKGLCEKPRFAYIDNQAKPLMNQKGLAPAMVNDILSVTPDKLYQIMAGNSVEGGGLLPCTEYFSNKSQNSPTKLDNMYSNLAVIILLFMMMWWVGIKD